MTIPEGVVSVAIRPININGREFRKVYIDLKHINYGKSGIKKRSDFEIDFVLRVLFHLHLKELEKERELNAFEYFSRILEMEDQKSYKLVICLPQNDNWIGIITFFRCDKK